MSATGPRRDERMLQLLADRATEGAEPKDEGLLKEWLASKPDFDEEAFDRAAALLALSATSGERWTLPGTLRNKLLVEADAFFARRDDGDA